MTDVSTRAPDGAGTTAAPPVTRIPHVPGLDGLRGLAVIGVLLFHGGFSWASGGYLGVSAFFTLSGYLITSLLIAEKNRTGRIALGTFWSRRVRRLLPASLAALAGISIYAWFWAPDLQRVHLRGDLIGSLFYVANWRLLARGSSYAEIQSSPSLVSHFWSLAIEEQFYVLWPLLVAGLLAWRGRRALVAASGVLLVGSVAMCIVLMDVVGSSLDAVYFGTGTRAAELLVGALLAVAVPAARAVSGPPERARVFVALGTVALVVMLVLWSVAEHGDAWQYRGGFALHGVLTAVVVAGVVHPGPLGRVLSWRPLRAAGLVSYGLYLYHWPVFVIVDEDRLDIGQWPLFGVRMAITIGLTLVSYRFLEQPIRRGGVIPERRLWPAALLGMFVVLVLILLGTRNPPQVAFGDFDPTEAAVSVVTAPPQTTPTAPPDGTPTTEAPGDPTSTTAVPVPPPVAVMTIGDSGMYDATPALRATFFAVGTSSSVEAAFPGIGLTNEVGDWRTDWRRKVEENTPELSIVMLGGFDLEYLEANGPEAYGAIADELMAILTSRGGRVAWLSVLPCGDSPDEELNAVFADVAARFPGQAAYIDTAEVFPGCATEEAVDGVGIVPIRKPDRWHLCPLGAERFARFVHAEVAALGWAPPPVTGWETGDWRLDARYDDPPGGCEVQ